MQDFKFVDSMQIINNHYPRAHFIIIITVHWSLFFCNEEKPVALLVYSSFVRVATGDFRIFPYSLVVVVVCAPMGSDSGIFPHSLQHGIVRVVLVTSPG